MSVVSIAMLKGGLGKTTTALNLAAALREMGRSVLLIDADPQAGLSEALGLGGENSPNLFTELSKMIRGEEGQIDHAIHPTACGLDLVPSSIELAGAELELVSVYGREQVLGWMLEKTRDRYDFVLIDCPPAMGMLTVNALVASDFILMPMQAEFLPLKGLRVFLRHIQTISRLNRGLEVLGYVINKYDDRKGMHRQIREAMAQEFGEKLFRTFIRTNIKLAKAQEAGTDIFHFDRHAHGAEDYAALATEFLQKAQNPL